MTRSPSGAATRATGGRVARRDREDQAGPTGVLARFAAGLEPEDLPPRVAERTIDLLIDALACALAADQAEEIRQVDALDSVLGAVGDSTVVGRSERRAPAAAAVANAYRITALTACDVYTPAHFHVTPEVVPAALVAAEAAGIDGSTVLTALAAGFEVATRVAAGLGYESFRARGWHTPGVAGPFGAAAAAGRIASLDALRMRHALGLAASQSAGTWAAWGTATVKFHQARAALSGLLAARLAEHGFVAGEEVLVHPDGGLLGTYSDGGDPGAVTADLGQRWELERISVRPWPGATPLQPMITGLFELIDDGRLDAPSARQVRVAVAPAVHDQHARFRHPTGTFEAMLSLHFAAAAVLRFGRLRFDEFMPSVYESPEVRDVIDEQVEITIDPGLSPLQCRITLDPGTDTQETLAVDLPHGHPDRPAGRTMLLDKFAACADGILDRPTAQRAVERLEDLAHVRDMREVLALLRPAA